MEFEQYKEFERKITQEELDEGKGFLLFEGESPILLSAPHAVSQIREGKIKVAETRTGLIVKQIGEKTCSPYFIKTKNQDDDANFDDRSTYRDSMISYVKNEGIKVLMDFHISASYRDFDLDIGTRNGENTKMREDFLTLVCERYQEIYPNTKIDHTFRAMSLSTVSSHISSETGIFAIQIEINWSLIDCFEKMNQFIEKTVEIVEEMKKKL